MGIVYIIILIIHLFAIQAADDTLSMATKPMLMVALLMFFGERAPKALPKIKTLIYLALIFSLAGDVLLMFQQQNSQFFIFGLSAFLLAHVCYIVYFRAMKKVNQSAPDAPKRVSAILALAYAGMLLWALFPRLGSMQVPVVVYSGVITLMLLSAIYAYRGMRYGYEVLSVLGAVLFVASDSLLAINKFHTPFAGSGFLYYAHVRAGTILHCLGLYPQFEAGKS